MHHLLDLLLFLRIRHLLLVSPHDGSGHDEKAKVDKDDEYYWSNESPDEISRGVQETPARRTEVTYCGEKCLKDLRSTVAIAGGGCRQGIAYGQGEETQVEQWSTIAGHSEGQHVQLLALDKDLDQHHIEDHPFHQHPHEGDQEEVVEEDSHSLAVDGDTSVVP